jgi:hypothetical protein
MDFILTVLLDARPQSARNVYEALQGPPINFNWGTTVFCFSAPVM